MKQYQEMLRNILETGCDKSDRTGVGVRSKFGLQMRFDLQEGFPAVTTKKLAFKSVVSELLWFIEGSSDERRLAEIHYGNRDDQNKTIWAANANADYWKPKANFDGDLGRVYGKQWTQWSCPDGSTKNQLTELIDNLIKNPNDRRHIVTAWNPGELDQMALPPCHCFIQFYVANNNLSCLMHQRSCDMFLGVPFNIASYALLTHMIAQVCGYGVGEFIHNLGDAHIYANHFDQVKEQITRKRYPLPKLLLNPNITSLDKFTMNDVSLVDYQSWPSIKAPMAV